jgi:hypothetical protein
MPLKQPCTFVQKEDVQPSSCLTRLARRTLALCTATMDGFDAAQRHHRFHQDLADWLIVNRAVSMRLRGPALLLDGADENSPAREPP